MCSGLASKSGPGGQGLFLDFDGTIADSLSAMQQVYDCFLETHGVSGSTSEFDSLNGPPIRTVVGTLREAHQLPGSLDQLVGEYEGHIAEATRKIKPATGARELISKASATGWPVVVVTSASRAHVRAWLASNRLSGPVTGIVGAEDVTTGKPSPEPYLTALEEFRCDAQASIAVEDSRQGIAAAAQAGLTVFALGWRHGDFQNEIFRDLVHPVRSLVQVIDAIWPT